MAVGTKKTHVPEDLAYIRWAAWGVMDIEVLQREPRRNYLMSVRAELATRGYKLECGGTMTQPYYRIYLDHVDANSAGATPWSVTSSTAVKDAFMHVCRNFLMREDPEHANGSAAAG